MPFETWDAKELRVTSAAASVSLVDDDGFWVFPDGTEADLTKVQERLRALSNLEATDFDLMAPLTSEMGSVEVVLEAEDDDSERPVISFSFFAPLQEGGKAMVQVAGRNSVMGVEVEDVAGILGDLESLRAEPPDESGADSE